MENPKPKPYGFAPEGRSEIKLNQYRLSRSQKSHPNPDPNERYWPQIFFWTEDVRLLTYAGCVIKRLEKQDAGVQEQFWQGIVPPDLLEDSPSAFATKISTERIIEYCAVRKSKMRAFWVLASKARREKLNPKGTVSIGGVYLDDKCYALRTAEWRKSVEPRWVRRIIEEAAKRNDIKFFIQLGRVLQKRRKAPEVDWTRCDPVACFLLVNWCEATHFRSDLPLLCLFTDQALADFCSIALGRKDGNPSSETIRKWRRHLGLKRPKGMRIRKVTRTRNEILFA